MQASERTSGRAASRLARRLAEGRFAVTAEVSPPVATDAARFLERARPIAALATAVNVTDGAGAKAHLSSLVAAHLLAGAGIEPVLQMTGRDRNRLALQADLLGARALGLVNLLLLSGDDPTAGDQPEAKAVFDYDGRALLAMAHGLRTAGRLPNGVEVAGPVDLLLGAADSPVDPPPDWQPKSLMAKAEAGVDFVQTQFCMDAGVVRRYAARLVDLGIAPRVKVLVGVCPIPSAHSARWMREKLFGTVIADAIVERLERAADPRTEGKRICVELMQELATIPGIAGAHVMAPQNLAAVPEVIEASGLA